MVLAVCLGSMSWLASPASAIPVRPEVDVTTGQPIPFVCPITELYYEKVGGLDDDLFRGGCPLEGQCDDPSTRDATATTSKAINVIVHVMNSDSGTPPNGVTQSTVNDAIAELNSNFGGTGFTFTLANTRFHNDSNYHFIPCYNPNNSNWYAAILSMKDQYAEDPANNCNIFVTCQDPSRFGVLLGIGTFPWDTDALANRGGLWMNGAYFGAGERTLAHEMGHCLGLWHTHHGVSEVTSCGSCYEFASNPSDVRGDFCSDTPPTPTNFNCAPPGGSDCQGAAWGPTQPENYMGYAPDNCYTTFTGQQEKRMHCWTDDILGAWTQGCTDPAPNAPGGLAATAAGTSQVDLAWSDNSGNETGFTIERDAGGGFAQIAQVGANTTNYSDTGLTCESSYSYRVYASNCGGDSGFSNTASATTGTCPAGNDVHVSAIDVSIVQNGPWTRARSTVTVVDASGSPVANATVSGTFVGTTNGGGSGLTDAAGQMSIDSPRIRNANNYCWAFTVDNITGAGLTYDAGSNVESCDENGNNCTAGGCDGSRIGQFADGPFVVSVEPNPFRSQVTIGFDLSEADAVRLDVYDVTGRKVRTLLNGQLGTGDHRVEWNGRNDLGDEVHDGIYFYRLSTPAAVQTGRLIMLR